ncbi:MAG: hypothetical protein ABIH65_01610 [Nanoarchaeota archaeon]
MSRGEKIKMDGLEVVERHLILLLGVKETPIKSDLYLQKEMFILSNSKEELKDELNFDKHYYGPYSQILQEILLKPTYIKDPFDFDGKRILLSENGKKEYERMIKEYSKDKRFSKLLLSLKLIREMYDVLSSNELLFLIYETYPDYVDFSSVAKEIINEPMRSRIIDSLFSKGIITDERYKELKNERK